MEPLKADFWIHEWLVQPSLNRLVGPEHSVQLEPRIMGVLLRLAEEDGGVVPREALMEAVWPDVVVTDDPLNRAVSELRKVFGDDPRDPAFIETIRKVGYRLIAPISSTPPGKPAYDLNGALAVAPGDGMAESDDDAIPTLAPSARRFPLVAVAGIVLILSALLALRALVPDRRDAPAPRRPVPLTSLPGMETGPAFSNEGSRIAFAWGGTDHENVDLYVRLVDEETPLRLTTHPARDESPVWSPDDRYIAFVRRTPSSCAILRIPALGGREEKLADCTATDDLTWSGDGSWIAFSDRPAAGAPYGIYRLSTRTLEVQRLTNPPPATEGDHFPAFSPDSPRLAFVRSRIAGLDYVYLMPAHGGPAVQQTSANERIRDLIWAEPNTLIYTSDWNGTYSLYTWSLRGRKATWLISGSDGVNHPAYTPRTARIAYEEWRWNKDIWTVPLGPDAPRPYPETRLNSTRWDRSPQTSPDGTQVVFVSNRSGAYEVWMWDRDSDQVVMLTDFGGPNLNMPRWSPDGRSIAFDVRTDGNADVYTLSVEGGRPQRLTTNAALDVVPSWSHDGQWIYFGSNRSGAWEVWEKPVAGGEARPVTHGGGFAALESPDGRYVYFTRPDADGLWQQPVDGGEAVQLLDRLAANDWGNWAVTEAGLYFVDRAYPLHTTPAGAEAGAALVVYDFTTRTITPLFQPGSPIANPGLTVAPDDAYLLYVQIGESEADLMMLE